MNLKPGPATYYDHPGSEPQPVEIVDVQGALYARFPADDHGEGADVLVDDLQGIVETHG